MSVDKKVIQLQQKYHNVSFDFLDKGGDIVQQLNSKSMYDPDYARAAGN